MNRLNALFKALANPGRRRVYQVICRGGRRDRRGLTVDQICRITGLKQPSVSHHLARLATAGLINRTRSRTWVHCAPRAGGLRPLQSFLRNPARTS
ncbi:MAG TPA: metalloregulator ArsR/SmtB family transcription factor [Planctomycetota bacterium]|nr:metalloregulator ArsR/SmtB family transcription factor [Planctomycetota bacterium]